MEDRGKKLIYGDVRPEKVARITVQRTALHGGLEKNRASIPFSLGDGDVGGREKKRKTKKMHKTST